MKILNFTRRLSVFGLILNFRQGLNLVIAEQIGGRFGGQIDGQFKRVDGAEFLKRRDPRSMIESLSLIFDVPFFSNHQG